MPVNASDSRKQAGNANSLGLNLNTTAPPLDFTPNVSLGTLPDLGATLSIRPNSPRAGVPTLPSSPEQQGIVPDSGNVQVDDNLLSPINNYRVSPREDTIPNIGVPPKSPRVATPGKRPSAPVPVVSLDSSRLNISVPPKPPRLASTTPTSIPNNSSDSNIEIYGKRHATQPVASTPSLPPPGSSPVASGSPPPGSSPVASTPSLPPPGSSPVASGSSPVASGSPRVSTPPVVSTPPGSPVSTPPVVSTPPGEPTSGPFIISGSSSPPPFPNPRTEQPEKVLESNKNQTQEAPIDIPDDHVYIETQYGSYIVPKYDEMTQADQAMHRNTFNLRFQLLNQSWRRYGLTFDLVRPEETLTNIHIRYKQAVRYIMARSGADFYKLFLVLGWMAVEVICVKIGLKASGYTMSQLRMYEVYQTYLIEMGEISGFGDGWPAWVKILVISAVNAAVFVLLNTFIGNGAGQSDQIMRLLSQYITGQSSTVNTEGNDLGVPQPNDPPPVPNAGGGGIPGLGNGNIDLVSIISGLGTMFTGQMQNNQPGGVTVEQNSQAPDVNTRRARRRANRSRPTYTS